MTAISIILADPQYLSGEGFRRLFAGHDDLEVVADVNNSSKLLEAVKVHTPDLVVFDYNHTDQFSISDIAEVVKLSAKTRFLVVTADDDKENVFKVLESGVTGFLTKNCSREEILNATYASAKGEKFFCNRVLDILLEKHLKPEEPEDCEPTNLSVRELEIVKLIVEGKTAKDIAAELHLSPHTVYTHRKNIMKKLGISSASELVMYAISKGIVKPENQS